MKLMKHKHCSRMKAYIIVSHLISPHQLKYILLNIDHTTVKCNSFESSLNKLLLFFSVLIIPCNPTTVNITSSKSILKLLQYIYKNRQGFVLIKDYIKKDDGNGLL